MQWFKGAMVVSSAMMIAAALSAQGCSSGGNTKDGGGGDVITSADVKPKPDGGTTGDGGQCGSGLTCEVCDVSGYSPQAMGKAVAAPGSCTAQQLQDFVTACFSTNATQATCSAWAKLDSGACGTCLAPVNATAASWGPFFCPSQTSCPLNAGGCADLVAKTVSAEKAAGGAGSCGDLITVNFGCQDYACAGCTAQSDFSACDQSAIANECKVYVDPVNSATGPCGPINGDAAPAKIQNCFPQTDADNVNFVDVFCGTGPG